MKPKPRMLETQAKPNEKAHNSTHHHKQPLAELQFCCLSFTNNQNQKTHSFLQFHHNCLIRSIVQSHGRALRHDQRPRPPLNARPHGPYGTTHRTGSPPPNLAPRVSFPPNQIQSAILHRISSPRLRLALLPLQ